jgi:glycosyltransferase involved in cell wall biosynthesis
MQKPHLPIVSIALCTYNGEKFLKKQVDSILLQDYLHLEIVVIDDCSTDDTYRILIDYQLKDSRIILSQNKQNLGYTRNFEKAIMHCSGQYIALADQDDVWETNKISEMVKVMDGNLLVYHDSDFIDDQDRRIGADSMASRSRMYDGESSLPFILYNCVSGHASLFDRKLLGYVLPFQEGFYHDWWIAYVAFNVGRVKFLNKVLVHYRQHQQNVTDVLEIRKRKKRRRRSATGKLKRMSVDLDFLRYRAGFKFNREPELIKEVDHIFEDLSHGKNRAYAFSFLYKHFDLLFYIPYRPKGFFSKINLLRKICL